MLDAAFCGFSVDDIQRQEGGVTSSLLVFLIDRSAVFG